MLKYYANNQFKKKISAQEDLHLELRATATVYNSSLEICLFSF